MSIDQRKLIGEATQWILRIALAIASFLMVSDFNEFKGDMKDTVLVYKIILVENEKK